jgi:hypothetical protein
MEVAGLVGGELKGEGVRLRVEEGELEALALKVSVYLEGQEVSSLLVVEALSSTQTT